MILHLKDVKLWLDYLIKNKSKGDNDNTISLCGNLVIKGIYYIQLILQILNASDFQQRNSLLVLMVQLFYRTSNVH